MQRMINNGGWGPRDSRLLDCPVAGEQCALSGCFYANLERRIKRNNRISENTRKHILEENRRDWRHSRCKER
jgi:hypothetical protein